MKDSKYLVYRLHHDRNYNEKMTLYGWSDNKAVVLSFIKQRNPNKYKVLKIKNTVSEKVYIENELTEDHKIDRVLLKSLHIDGKIPFFTTSSELGEAEINILKYFREISNTGLIKGDGDYVTMLMNLKDIYREALNVIGFRPPDIENMFQSSEEYPSGDWELIMDSVSGSYANGLPLSSIDNTERLKVPYISDPIMKCLFSLEAFIKILKDDL